MLRSMYSGISGLKNFQTKLDVIGNNIANVNTFGFKKGRVTFKDTMSQMVSGASAATDNRGGKNATQVGLGASLATIDTVHTGSSLQSTGRSLDLGIDGDGYFVVSQNGANMYTRAGNFYLDDNGSLVNADGLKVQAFQQDGTMGDVAINVNAILPGIETTAIKFTENLSANANIGSVFSQQVKVVDSKGNSIPTTIYFKKLGTDNWGVFMDKVPKPSEVVPTPQGTTAGKITVINPGGFTGVADPNPDWQVKYDTSAPAGYKLSKNGGTSFPFLLSETNGILTSPDLEGLQIDVSSLRKVAAADSKQTKGTSGDITIAGTFDSSFEGDIIIKYDGGSSSYKFYKSGDDPATAQIYNSVSNKVFGLDFTLPAPGIPVDGDEWSIAVKPQTVKNGNAWNLDITAATQPDQKLNFVGGQIPTNNSKITMDLTVSTGIANDPNTIADESKQKLTGIELDFSALTQFEGSNTALVDPDGNAEGKLESYNIGSLGEINGVYSNGEIVNLGRLALAKFSNTSGLTKVANNLFQESINSGTADINVAGEGRGTLASGSLEMSNVDLSEEFTDMIVAQRGFQANTRIITTSDEILQELVNLKR